MAAIVLKQDPNTQKAAISWTFLCLDLWNLVLLITVKPHNPQCSHGSTALLPLKPSTPNSGLPVQHPSSKLCYKSWRLWRGIPYLSASVHQRCQHYPPKGLGTNKTVEVT